MEGALPSDLLRSRLLLVGCVARPHGLKGAFLMKPAGSNGGQNPRDPLFSRCQGVYVGKDVHSLRFHELVEASWMPKGWKLSLAMLSSIEQAQALKGASLYIPKEWLPPTKEDEYRVEDLIGCRLVDHELGPVGLVEAVEASHVTGPGPAGNGPASIGSDRWWIRTANGSLVAIPAVKRFISKVDISSQTVHVVDFNQLL